MIKTPPVAAPDDTASEVAALMAQVRTATTVALSLDCVWLRYFAFG